MIQTVDKTVFKQKGLEMVFLWRINSGEANQQKSDKKGLTGGNNPSFLFHIASFFKFMQAKKKRHPP